MAREKLCRCKAGGCFVRSTTDPTTGQSISGVYLPISTWSRHKKRDRETAFEPSILQPTKCPSNAECPDDPDPQAQAAMELDLSIGTGIDRTAIAAMESQVRLQNHKHLIQITVESIEIPNSPVLEFSFNPTTEIQFDSFCQSTALLLENPRLALKPGRPENDRLESCKASLINIWFSLDDIATFNQLVLEVMKQELCTLIMGGLSRIHSLKAMEWERQARRNFHLNKVGDNVPYFVSTEEYVTAYIRLHNLPPTVMLSLLLAVILHNLCHLSRAKSNFVLTVLQCIHYFTFWKGNKTDPLFTTAFNNVHKDIRTAEALFNLSPKLIKYLSCVACRKLYHPDDLDYEKGQPETCDHQEYSEGPFCGKPLWKRRYIKGIPYFHPRMTFHLQDFPSWLGRFLSRPGIENLLREPLMSLAKNTSPHSHRDIWDGRLVRSFKDTSGRPFFQYSGPELRLLFGIGYDGFNPFHIKAAGKKGTVGAIFLFCYNLPSDIRLRPENVHIVGVIPGPNHPSLTQINHYVRPLVNVLLKFYDPGFFIWGLPDHAHGLLSKGAVWPAIMDSLAVRQMFGLGAIISNWPCFSCRIGAEDIDDVIPDNWPAWHSPREHRELAEKWRTATTESARGKLFTETGIRWSEFCRLPYFDVTKMCIIDPMHSIQNLCRNLVMEVWKMDPTQLSGDGLFIGPRPAPSKPVTNGECVTVLRAIKENNTRALERMRRYPLWHICERHELRRAGERVRPYRETLKKFYLKNPNILLEDLSYFRAKSQHATVGDPPIIRNIRLGLAVVSNDNREETKQWLESQLLNDLHLICRERKIGYMGTESEEELAEKLIQLETSIPVASSDLARGLPVLGSDILTEINNDMERTILPSWVQPGPKTYDGLGHGKLSANEWRTHVVVRLAITLPRVWTNVDDRHQSMLDNFMHLINAIIIASSRVVVTSMNATQGQTTANLYRSEYLAYLRGRIELYPTIKIQPTEHVAYHIADQWEEVSPSHVTSTNHLERMNGMLQDINTNKRWSELEDSMVKTFCASANTKILMETDLLSWFEHHGNSGEPLEPDGRKYLQQIQEQFLATCGIEGSPILSEVMDFSASRYFTPKRIDLEHKPKGSLKPVVFELLILYLRHRYQTGAFTFPLSSTPSSIFLTAYAWPLTECQYYGTWFRIAVPNKKPSLPIPQYIPPHKDSYIWFLSSCSGYRTAGVIIDMFAYEHNIPNSPDLILNTYLVVRRFTQLNAQHQLYDPWRTYPLSGGRLFYYQTDMDPEVIDIRDVCAHVAVTPYEVGEIKYINHPCIHALPLIWHNMFRPYNF